MVLCVGALALSSSPASLLRARKVSREYAQNQPSIAQAPFVKPFLPRYYVAHMYLERLAALVREMLSPDSSTLRPRERE